MNYFTLSEFQVPVDGQMSVWGHFQKARKTCNVRRTDILQLNKTKLSFCDVMKKHDVEVLECTEASGVVMTLRKSQTGILLH